MAALLISRGAAASSTRSITGDKIRAIDSYVLRPANA
jgi:hypothetical protein